MKPRHTSGPWIAEGYNIRKQNGRHVAYCGPHHTPPEIYPRACKLEDEANAALIAAAPDLLAFAEEAFKSSTSRRLRRLAREQIAKVKGQCQ
jgi:hypothetical protein